MASILVTPWRDGYALIRLRACLFPTSDCPDLRRKACSQVSLLKSILRDRSSQTIPKLGRLLRIGIHIFLVFDYGADPGLEVARKSSSYY